MSMNRILLALLVVVALAAGSRAQTPASAPGATAGQAPAAPAAPAAAGTAKPSPLEPQGFTYDPENRRDPFVSLLRRGGDPTSMATGDRPAGLAGMTADEVALRGIMSGATGQWVAVLQGVDRRTYLARAGDRLLDGTIQTITRDSMVILQRVNDPLSLATQREVRKVLRQEEAK
jgi:Tfp pilus assembly protein PilP